MSTLHRILVAGSVAATLAAPAIAGPLPTNVVAVKSAVDSGPTKAAWGGWGHGHWGGHAGGHWGHGGWGWFPGAFLGGLVLGAAVSSYPYDGYGYGYPYGYASYGYPAYAYSGGPYYAGYYGHNWARPYWRHRWHHHW